MVTEPWTEEVYTVCGTMALYRWEVREIPSYLLSSKWSFTTNIVGPVVWHDTILVNGFDNCHSLKVQDRRACLEEVSIGYCPRGKLISIERSTMTKSPATAANAIDNKSFVIYD
jgi:hypothetical protein